MVSIYYVCGRKKFESYFRDRLTFSNVDSRTSRRIYRLALLLRAPETLSSLSKSRISIFNAHLTLLVRKMTSHNSIGKYTQTPLIRTPLIRALPSTGQGSRQNCLYIHTSWNSVAQLATAIMAALPEQLQGKLHFITRLGPRTPPSCNYC